MSEWGSLNDLPFNKEEIALLTKLPRVVEFIDDLLEEVEQAKKVNIHLKSSKKIKRKTYCIAQIDPDTKEQVAIFKNVKETATALGCSRENVRRSLLSKKYKCMGFHLKRLHNFKICTSCGLGDSIENFDKGGITKNGVQSYKSRCKKCMKTINKKYNERRKK